MLNKKKIQQFFILAPLCLSIFLHPVSPAPVNSTSRYVPDLHILLNCGSPSDVNDNTGLKWAGDVGSKFTPSSRNTFVYRASTQHPSVSQIPYMTTRIFRSQFTYTFPVIAGRKFIRLYFYPTSYGNFSASNAFFSVSAGNYTLLHNFNPSITSTPRDSPSIIREFSVDSPKAGILDLTFTPESSFAHAYAFVNGIEIVSMPEIHNSGEAILVGMGTPFTIVKHTAFETVFRLNVGGNDISPVDDSGLFRSWSSDEQYAMNGLSFSRDPDIMIEYKDLPFYIAPPDVYSTARSMGASAEVDRVSNLTWTFTVDSRFYYLVRLHFCEIQSNVASTGARVFLIYISGGQTATDKADGFAWTKGNGIPLYKDYVVPFIEDGFQNLRVALHTNLSKKPIYDDAFLNGIEIFKFSDWKGNLAGLDPISLQKVAESPTDTVGATNSKVKLNVGLVAALASCVSFISFLLSVLCCRRKRKDSRVQLVTPPSLFYPLSSTVCRHFSFAEIKAATEDFNEALLLGTGGFGNVYKGEINGGTARVAIKRGSLESGQGMREFQTEIKMLSKLVHRHLVSLVGYCGENGEMILVYDYMGRGTLRDHLYGTRNPPHMEAEARDLHRHCPRITLPSCWYKTPHHPQRR